MLTPDQGRKDFLRTAAAAYRDALPGSLAEEHLVNRDLGGVAQRFGLGFVDEPREGHERFQGMLSIPYIRPKKQVIQIRFRCITAGCAHEYHGKYNSEDHDASNVYNTLALADDPQVIVIAEGETDTMVCESVGVRALGIAGANLWRRYYPLLVEGVPRVIVIGDGDDAGRVFAKQVHKAVPQSRKVIMPGGHDINSFVSEHGADKFKEFIKL